MAQPANANDLIAAHHRLDTSSVTTDETMPSEATNQMTQYMDWLSSIPSLSPRISVNLFDFTIAQVQAITDVKFLNTLTRKLSSSPIADYARGGLTDDKVEMYVEFFAHRRLIYQVYHTSYHCRIAVEEE